MIGQESHGRDHKRRPHEACLQGGLSPGYDLPGIDINIVDSTIQGTIIGSENRLEIHLSEKQGPCFYCLELFSGKNHILCSFCEDFIGTFDPTFLLGCI